MLILFLLHASTMFRRSYKMNDHALLDSAQKRLLDALKEISGALQKSTSMSFRIIAMKHGVPRKTLQRARNSPATTKAGLQLIGFRLRKSAYLSSKNL